MKKLLVPVLILMLSLSLVGCSNANQSSTGEIKMGRVDYAAHGTKSFTSAVVAMQGDKIVGASLDEYQFLSTEDVTGVPNSDALAEGDFATNYKDPKVVLASKITNKDYYSEHMKELAGSTVPYDENLKAIESYVVGKTVAELEKAINEHTPEEMIDAVSGATLQDTQGYVKALVEAAKAAK